MFWKVPSSHIVLELDKNICSDIELLDFKISEYNNFISQYKLKKTAFYDCVKQISMMVMINMSQDKYYGMAHMGYMFWKCIFAQKPQILLGCSDDGSLGNIQNEFTIIYDNVYGNTIIPLERRYSLSQHNVIISTYTIRRKQCSFMNKGNNKITELRTILQRESQNS